MELLDLGDHLSLCSGGSGRWFALRCAGEAVHAFLAARLVTTVVVLMLAGAVASALF